MPLSSISPRRPLTSYVKVQILLGNVIRNRAYQLTRPRLRGLTYLDIGCGLNPHDGFINLDYLWHPKVDVCWDITRGLPFADGSMRGIFSEHCLEHFPLPAALALLREVRRVLAPGGTVRIVVPDGGLYLRLYGHHHAGDVSQRFPFQDKESFGGFWTPMLSVNRIFYQDRESLFGHRTMFDFDLLSGLLGSCGFTHMECRQFGAGRDPRLLIDTPARAVESLYVEASAP